MPNLLQFCLVNVKYTLILAILSNVDIYEGRLF